MNEKMTINKSITPQSAHEIEQLKYGVIEHVLDNIGGNFDSKNVLKVGTCH